MLTPRFPNFPQAARDHGWEVHLEISPVTGRERLRPCANDVWNVVDVLGGPAQAAKALNVEEIEVEAWIDAHYVPARYAKEIQRLTGWSVWSIQSPPFDGQASVGAVE